MLVGPVVGFGLVLASMFAYALVYLFQNGAGELMDILKIIPLVLIFGTVYALIIGPLPALITGMVARLGKSNVQQRTYAVICGAIICSLGGFLIYRDLSATAITALLGGASGFCCIALWHRKIRKLNS